MGNFLIYYLNKKKITAYFYWKIKSLIQFGHNILTFKKTIKLKTLLLVQHYY